MSSAENTSLHSRNYNSHKWDVKRFGRGFFYSANKLRPRFEIFYKQSSQPAHSSFTAERGPFSTASKSCCRVSANYGHIPPLNYVSNLSFDGRRNSLSGHNSSSRNNFSPRFGDRRNNFGGSPRAIRSDFPSNRTGREDYFGTPCRSAGGFSMCSKLDKYPVHLQQGFD